MLYDQSNLNNFYNMELKKKILETIFTKITGFLYTIKLHPVLVKIFVFGIQIAHCFSTLAKIALACHRMNAKV